MGPTFANIFLCYHERRWLDDCPNEFKPKYYRRYVDDCFLIFDDPSHIDSFLNYLNGCHPKMKFTKELERDRSIPFLDVNVKRMGSQLTTSVYRKPSFTGLGLSYFSFIPKTIKRAVVQSAVFRAFNLCSDYKLLDCELKFLRSFFKSNGFPSYILDFTIRKFLDGRYLKAPDSFQVPKLKKYLVLPFFGEQSLHMQKDVVKVLTDFYPYLDPRVVLRNTFTIGSMFRFKDRVPKACCSGIVYKYCCSSCGESYIGSTNVRLKTRVCQHMGISDRTGNMVQTPTSSSVRDHSLQCGTAFSLSDFNILDRIHSVYDLRLLESLYIFKQKPALNGKGSAAPLHVVT